MQLLFFLLAGLMGDGVKTFVFNIIPRIKSQEVNSGICGGIRNIDKIATKFSQKE